MIQFDKLNIRILRQYTKHPDYSRLAIRESGYPTSNTSQTNPEYDKAKPYYVLDNNKVQIPGLIRMCIKEDTVYFDISSKILGDDYFQGITSANFAKLIKALNDTGLIQIPANIEPYEFKASYVEIKRDIVMQKNPCDYLILLNRNMTNTKYMTSKYTRETLYVTRTSKYGRDSISFYDKSTEMETSLGKGFTHLLPEEHTMRFEIKFLDSDAIKKKSAFGSTNLQHIIETPDTIYIHKFDDLFNTTIMEGRNIMNLETEKFSQEFKIRGMLDLLREYNWRMDAVESYIKKRNPNNSSTFISELRRVQSAYMQLQPSTQMVNEIREKLKQLETDVDKPAENWDAGIKRELNKLKEESHEAE